MIIGKLRDSFIRIMYTPATIFTVAILGIYTLVWGFWLANPFWYVFSHASLYDNMAATAPEVSWGCSAIVAACIMLYGAARHSYWGTRIGGATIFVYWLIIAIMYLTADWHNTGGITSMLFALWGAYVFVNAKLNRDKLFPIRGNFALRKKR